MKAKSLKSQLLVMGESLPLIEDYLDSAQSYSVEGYQEYKRREERSVNSQVRWDAQQKCHAAFTGSLPKKSGAVQ